MKLIFIIIVCLSSTAFASEWSTLSPETQAILTSFESDWESFDSSKQDKLISGAKRWLTMD